MAGRSISIESGSGPTWATVDAVAAGLVTIDTGHARAHAGQAFVVHLTDAALVNAASLEILIQTPATGEIHMNASVVVGGNSSVFFFEDTTVSAAGAALAEINRNRQSALVTTVATFSGPTITGDGTQLFGGLIAGGTGGNANGGSKEFDAEMILAVSSNYMVRLTNVSGGNIAAALALNFYDTNL